MIVRVKHGDGGGIGAHGGSSAYVSAGISKRSSITCGSYGVANIVVGKCRRNKQ